MTDGNGYWKFYQIYTSELFFKQIGSVMVTLTIHSDNSSLIWINMHLNHLEKALYFAFRRSAR